MQKKKMISHNSSEPPAGLTAISLIVLALVLLSAISLVAGSLT